MLLCDSILCSAVIHYTLLSCVTTMLCNATQQLNGILCSLNSPFLFLPLSHTLTHTHTLFSLSFYGQSAMSSSKRELLGAPIAEDAGNVTVRIKCFPTNMVYRPGRYCMCVLYVRTFFCFFFFFTQPLLSSITSPILIHFFYYFLTSLFYSSSLGCFAM
jgi:hypothetical protein